MLKKFLKNDKGLTLVELLAVIVILGIIAAIAVPSIGGIINKSKDDAKVAEAIQIINAAKLAYAENTETTTWDNAALDEYLDNVEDTTYSVNYNGSAFTITGHAAAPVLNSSNDDETVVTEAQLTTAAR
ncbi:type II secretion system GspH family protein [Bacillus haikouensis]|nr:type II secretion system GspH family protein [Bacillus haikouensis]